MSESRGKKQASDFWLKTSEGLFPFRDTLAPLLLMLFVPPLMCLLPVWLVDYDGDCYKIWNQIQSDGFTTAMYNMWPEWKNPVAWKILMSIIGLELLLVRIVPGGTYTQIVPSPAGIRYSYSTNGMQCFVITMFLYWLGAFLGYYNGGILVDYLGQIVSAVNVFSLVMCLVLYLKGIFLPSSADHGSTGNVIFDYFWGTELNPRIFGWDVKQITNARFGMIFWGLFCLAGILKQWETYGVVYDTMWVSAGLQLLYVAKFYMWEAGYYASYDIYHDYAGFYLCWGCTVFMPGIYSSHMLYIATHPTSMGWQIASATIALGVLLTLVQFDADTQARRFRESGGKMKIWGKPAKFVLAKYTTLDGQEKTNMLLASGWFGICRHIRYTLDIIISIGWCMPVWTTKLTMEMNHSNNEPNELPMFE